MSDQAIEVDGLSKRFRIYRERNQTFKSISMHRKRARFDEFWALRDVSFEVKQGANFAIVGRNGSGKSTLLKCLAQILYPDAGSIRTRGRVTALLEIGSGFHPDLSGRDNVFLNAAILGFSRSEIRRRFDEIVEFSGVERFIDQPVKTYSSGMFVRLAFSVAIHVDPDILLLDEVLAVGDSGFQQKCVEKFAEFQSSGRTIVVVSHSIPVLATMCDSAVWLDEGKVCALGDSQDVLEAYGDAVRPQLRETSDGQQRWGTGAAEVDALEVIGPDGVPIVGPILPGTPVRFRLRYTARERIEQPLFTIGVAALDTINVWSGSTMNNAPPAAIEPGAGFVDFVVDRLPFAGADFLLSAAIHDDDSQVILDYAKDITRLRMKTHHRDESGYISLAGRWQYSE